MTICRQLEHAPLWHLSAQMCWPQDKVLPQVSPQVGVAKVHGSMCLLLPHGHRRTSLRGQGGHSPAHTQHSLLQTPIKKAFITFLTFMADDVAHMMSTGERPTAFLIALPIWFGAPSLLLLPLAPTKLDTDFGTGLACTLVARSWAQMLAAAQTPVTRFATGPIPVEAPPGCWR